MSGVASVLLADDHARTRAMVRHALEESGDFVVCAEAADAAGAVQKAKEAQARRLPARHQHAGQRDCRRG